MLGFGNRVAVVDAVGAWRTECDFRPARGRWSWARNGCGKVLER